jgi:hypothetical protein
MAAPPFTTPSSRAHPTFRTQLTHTVLRGREEGRSSTALFHQTTVNLSTPNLLPLGIRDAGVGRLASFIVWDEGFEKLLCQLVN